MVGVLAINQSLEHWQAYLLRSPANLSAEIEFLLKLYFWLVRDLDQERFFFDWLQLSVSLHVRHSHCLVQFHLCNMQQASNFRQEIAFLLQTRAGYKLVGTGGYEHGGCRCSEYNLRSFCCYHYIQNGAGVGADCPYFFLPKLGANFILTVFWCQFRIGNAVFGVGVFAGICRITALLPFLFDYCRNCRD